MDNKTTMCTCAFEHVSVCGCFGRLRSGRGVEIEFVVFLCRQAGRQARKLYARGVKEGSR